LSAWTDVSKGQFKHGPSFSEKSLDEVLAMADVTDVIAGDFTITPGVLNISETARNSDSLSYVPPEQ